MERGAERTFLRAILYIATILAFLNMVFTPDGNSMAAAVMVGIGCLAISASESAPESR